MLYIASDHGGYLYKEQLKKYLEKTGEKIEDCGTNSTDRVDAVDYALPAIKKVLKNESNKAILICRSGQIMSMFANRFKGIRAVACYSKKGAFLARTHLDANVLCLGADLVKYRKTQKIVQIFLKTEFMGGKYQERLNKLEKLITKVK